MITTVELGVPNAAGARVEPEAFATASRPAPAHAAHDPGAEWAPKTADQRLLNRVSALRDVADDLTGDVAELHDAVRAKELDERTTAAALRSPRELLDELSSGFGLSWSSIAKLSGVSATAVRKWRRGETMSPESRRAVARAVTFVEMLVENAGPLQDVGSWLEVPLSDLTTLTPIDLYALGHVTSLLDLAGGRTGAHAVLDAFDPRWRERYAPDTTFEVVDGGDGHLSISERSR
jgi:uncharacterized protein (DUF2384 family)